MLIGITAFVCACEKDEKGASDKQGVEKGGQRAVATTPNAGMVDFIKSQKLAYFPSTTIGSAFDFYRHVTKKEWKASTLQSGYITVDFTGWLEPMTLNENDIKDGVTGKGIDVTFVIELGGAFYVYMVSQIEFKTDGKVSRTKALDTAAVLADIYANRKISF